MLFFICFLFLLFIVAQVISQDEFKEYLISNGKFSDIKAETLTRQVFRKNKE